MQGSASVSVSARVISLIEEAACGRGSQKSAGASSSRSRRLRSGSSSLLEVEWPPSPADEEEATVREAAEALRDRIASFCGYDGAPSARALVLDARALEYLQRQLVYEEWRGLDLVKGLRLQRDNSSNLPRMKLRLSMFTALRKLSVSGMPVEYLDIGALSSLQPHLVSLDYEGAPLASLSHLLVPAAQGEDASLGGRESRWGIGLTKLGMGLGTGVPQECTLWESLKYLRLRRCSLAATDPSLRLLPLLQRANFSHNQLEIVDFFQDCSRLLELDLSFNRLRSLAGLAGKLGNVRILLLANNQLKITSGLEKMYSLEELDLSDNRLSEFNEVSRIARLPLLRSLQISGNSLTRLSRSRIRILSYFYQAKGDDSFASFTLDGKRASLLECRSLRRLRFHSPSLDVEPPRRMVCREVSGRRSARQAEASKRRRRVIKQLSAEEVALGELTDTPDDVADDRVQTQSNEEEELSSGEDEEIVMMLRRRGSLYSLSVGSAGDPSCSASFEEPVEACVFEDKTVFERLDGVGDGEGLTQLATVKPASEVDMLPPVKDQLEEEDVGNICKESFSNLAEAIGVESGVTTLGDDMGGIGCPEWIPEQAEGHLEDYQEKGCDCHNIVTPPSYMGDPRYASLRVIENLQLYLSETAFASAHNGLSGPMASFLRIYEETAIVLPTQERGSDGEKSCSMPRMSRRNLLGEVSGTRIAESSVFLVVTDMSVYALDEAALRSANPTFGDSPRLAVLWHVSLAHLAGLSIGPSFERLTLQASQQSDAADLVILTRDRSRTSALVQFLEPLGSDIRTKRGMGPVAVHSEDEAMLAALEASLGLNADEDEEILSYSLVLQRWEMRPWVLAPRALILTNLRAFLCDEDWFSQQVSEDAYPDGRDDENSGQLMAPVWTSTTAESARRLRSWEYVARISQLDRTLLADLRRIKTGPSATQFELLLPPTSFLGEARVWQLQCRTEVGAEKLRSDLERLVLASHSQPPARIQKLISLAQRKKKKLHLSLLS
jgi:hypothetical protein